MTPPRKALTLRGVRACPLPSTGLTVTLSCSRDSLSMCPGPQGDDREQDREPRPMGRTVRQGELGNAPLHEGRPANPNSVSHTEGAPYRLAWEYVAWAWDWM